VLRLRTDADAVRRQSASVGGGPRYTRQIADDRRLALIEATIASLKRSGYEGLSVRRIAAAAGVSFGLVNHHFPRKDVLVADAYRHFHRQLLESFEAAVARAPADPRSRIRAFIAATFAPPNLDRDVLNAWLVFWSLHRHSAPIRRAHRDTYSAYVDLVRGLLDELERKAGPFRLPPRLAAIGLTALLDGLWLECCLDPKPIAPRDAVSVCTAWLAGLN
jgi:AcrR family transcriptional regulator